MEDEGVELTPALLKSFACGKVSKEHVISCVTQSKDIVDLDFSGDGTLLYTCDETTLNVYETMSARYFPLTQQSQDTLPQDLRNSAPVPHPQQLRGVGRHQKGT